MKKFILSLLCCVGFATSSTTRASNRSHELSTETQETVPNLRSSVDINTYPVASYEFGIQTDPVVTREFGIQTQPDQSFTGKLLTFIDAGHDITRNYGMQITLCASLSFGLQCLFYVGAHVFTGGASTVYCVFAGIAGFVGYTLIVPSYCTIVKGYITLFSMCT